MNINFQSIPDEAKEEVKLFRQGKNIINLIGFKNTDKQTNQPYYTFDILDDVRVGDYIETLRFSEKLEITYISNRNIAIGIENEIEIENQLEKLHELIEIHANGTDKTILFELIDELKNISKVEDINKTKFKRFTDTIKKNTWILELV